MDRLLPGQEGPVTIPAKYNNWQGLFRMWRMGIRNIDPSRLCWEYRVENDLLLRKVTKKGLEEDLLVGVPIMDHIDEMGRRFYYRMSNWRLRMGDRAELAGCGGIPAMDLELSEYLQKLGVEHSSVPSAVHPLDRQALDFVHQWVANGGLSWKGDGVTRPHSRIQSGQEGLFVGYKSRSRFPTVGVARFDHENRTLIIRGQVGRSSEVSWAKDAVYVSFARVSGVSSFSSYQVVGQGFLCNAANCRILIKPVPAGVDEAWK